MSPKQASHSIYVIKRDGSKVPFDLSKIEKVVSFAVEGLEDKVDLDEFYSQFQFLFRNEITTREIQQNLINTASNLIYKKGEIRKEYSILANRLRLIDFWKELKLKRAKEYPGENFDEYGLFEDSHAWVEHIRKYVDKGIYDDRLLKISKDTLAHLYAFAKKLNKIRQKHYLWDNFLYQTEKFINSYLIKYNGKFVETFDEAHLLLSILAFYPDYRKNKKLFLKNVKEFYKHLTAYHFIPATPQLLNLRRAFGNLSSCNIMDIKDNLESIYHTLTQSAFISKNAGGIGIYAGRLRPSGSYLMGNPGISNDVRLWFKLFEDTAIAVNQGGNRKGAITVALPLWHKDCLEFISSRKPLGEKRLKLFDLYPQIVVPRLFLKKVKEKDYWYLLDEFELKMVDPSINLVDTVGEEFEKNYEKAVRLIEEGKVKNYKKVKATDLLSQIFDAILSSGFPYIFFDENANEFSPFKEKILCGNLCMESFSPFNNTNRSGRRPNEGTPEDEIGYAHSCNLFSLNLPRLYEDGYFEDTKKLRNLLSLVVRYMDNSIEIANPPVEEIEKHNREYRTIGIGFIGFADLLVKVTQDTGKLHTYYFTKKSAGDEAKREELKARLKDLVKRTIGSISFYAMLASCELAKERGRAPKFKETKWADGILLGRYKVDDTEELREAFPTISDAEIKELRCLLKKYGIRNTMLTNCPPNTSTSLYAGSSASILPVYNLISAETQKKSIYITFPRYVEHKIFYDVYIEADDRDMYDVAEFIAMVQKYIDSGISFEYIINRKVLKGRALPKFLAKFLFLCEKLGIKTLYYARSRTVSETEETCSACAN